MIRQWLRALGRARRARQHVDPRLTTLLDHLRGLQRLDRLRSIYGANRHNWQIRPPVAPSVLTHVEQGLGFRLPASYRAYLLTIGNGGAGPLFGIESLPLTVTPALQRAMQQPFMGLPALQHRLTEAGIVRHPDGYYEEWDKDLEAEVLHGTWPIAYEGCGHHTRIVLTGVAAGSILTVENANGIYHVHDDFLDWTIGWLAPYRHAFETGS